jgi:hypothetical protein
MRRKACFFALSLDIIFDLGLALEKWWFGYLLLMTPDCGTLAGT